MNHEQELPADLDNLIAGLRIENINLKLAAKQAEALLNDARKFTWDLLSPANLRLRIDAFLASQQGEQATAAENAQVGESFGEIGADGWRKIGKPAAVGAVSFGVGISSRLVVEAAQRHYEYSQDPAVEAERMQRISDFVASVREEHPEKAEGAQGERLIQTAPERIYLIVGAYCPRDVDFNELTEVSWCENDIDDGIEYVRADKARAAMAQPSPAPELERPEVVAYLNEWRHNDSGGIRVTPALSAMSEEGLQKEYGPQASVVRREPLMTVSQHNRIGLQWASLVHRAQAKADAAQARVAELEKQEPVAWRVATGNSWRSYDFASDARAAVEHWKRTFPNGEVEVQPLYAAPVAQAGQVPECFRLLLKHAHGMTTGVDWNNGTAASHHREPLGEAVVQCQAWLAAAPAQGGSADE